ncbi:MAG: heme-binding domain-containing protein [Bacteroidia bacterium]|jgi:hypothetical protein
MKFFTLNRAFYSLIVLLLAIQLYRPEPNIGNAYSDQDIFHYTTVPDNVKEILTTSCFDCHSNNTHYPWYSVVQPIGLWLQHHVDEGKDELNFTEFKTYTSKRQKHKMEEIVEMVREGEMPLKSYALIHGDTRLSEAQKKVLITWAESMYNGIQLNDE